MTERERDGGLFNPQFMQKGKQAIQFFVEQDLFYELSNVSFSCNNGGAICVKN